MGAWRWAGAPPHGGPRPPHPPLPPLTSLPLHLIARWRRAGYVDRQHAPTPNPVPQGPRCPSGGPPVPSPKGAGDLQHARDGQGEGVGGDGDRHVVGPHPPRHRHRQAHARVGLGQGIDGGGAAGAVGVAVKQAGPGGGAGLGKGEQGGAVVVGPEARGSRVRRAVGARCSRHTNHPPHPATHPSAQPNPHLNTSTGRVLSNTPARRRRSTAGLPSACTVRRDPSHTTSSTRSL